MDGTTSCCDAVLVPRGLLREVLAEGCCPPHLQLRLGRLLSGEASETSQQEAVNSHRGSVDNTLAYSKSSFGDGAQLSALLTQPFELTDKSDIAPRAAARSVLGQDLPRKERAASIASSTDIGCIREVLDAAVGNPGVAAHFIPGDTLAAGATELSPCEDSTDSSCDQRTVGKSEVGGLDSGYEQRTLGRSEIGSFGGDSRGATARLVADLQAAIVTESSDGGFIGVDHSAASPSRTSTAAKVIGRTGTRHHVDSASDGVDVNVSRAGSARSARSISSPNGSHNGRGHLVSAARSVLATQSHNSNVAKDHDKSATWSVAPAHFIASPDAFRPFAGRPATPESEHRRRQEKEQLRAMQRSAAFTIPFTDGERNAPPPGFIESIELHELRQKTRRKNAEEGCRGNAVSEKTDRHRLGRAPQHQNGGRQVEDAHSKSLPSVRSSVPTIHAPPPTHATLSAQKPAQGGRRSRSGGRPNGRGHAEPG